MNGKYFENSVPADWAQLKITHRPLKFLHFNWFTQGGRIRENCNLKSKTGRDFLPLQEPSWPF